MNYKKIVKYDIEKNKKREIANNKKASIILDKLKEQDASIKYTETIALDYLLRYYFKSKGSSIEKSILDLFQEYGFNYTESIRNGIYYLLGKRSDLGDYVEPTLWPGINHIKNQENNIF